MFYKAVPWCGVGYSAQILITKEELSPLKSPRFTNTSNGLISIKGGGFIKQDAVPEGFNKSLSWHFFPVERRILDSVH